MRNLNTTLLSHQMRKFNKLPASGSLKAPVVTELMTNWPKPQVVN